MILNPVFAYGIHHCDAKNEAEMAYSTHHAVRPAGQLFAHQLILQRKQCKLQRVV